MKRDRTLQLILTFPSAVAAMDMEDMARELGLPGRLIPIPTAITAGCGLAWKTEPEQREALERVLWEHDMPFEAFYTMLL